MDTILPRNHNNGGISHHCSILAMDINGGSALLLLPRNVLSVHAQM
jgi:hypothetical protein